MPGNGGGKEGSSAFKCLTISTAISVAKVRPAGKNSIHLNNKQQDACCKSLLGLVEQKRSNLWECLGLDLEVRRCPPYISFWHLLLNFYLNSELSRGGLLNDF